jgi:pantoate--beta-alanine ligase
MIVFNKKKELKKHLSTLSKDNTIGFTPTMGSLHEGHLSLIKKSKGDCNLSICSVFVNPTQFNDKNDYLSYPKNIEDDLSLLREMKCNIVYVPSITDVYPKNKEKKQYDFNGLDVFLEGKHRAGHFNGVATIVEELFQIIEPNYAYFGEKDLQQLCIIKQLVKNKNINTKIIGCPTIREKNGLAKSSRNKLLSQDDFEYCSIIYQQLTLCKKHFKKKSFTELKKQIVERLTKEDRIEIEYFEFVDIKTLKPQHTSNSKTKYAACIAVNISGVRLIDNIIL